MKDRIAGDADAAIPFGPVRLLFDNLGIISYHLNAVVLPLAERHDLGPRGVWVLRFIADGDVYPGAIAASMMVAPSLITADVQRLIRAELVVREPDSVDGRRIRLGLTARGRALLKEAYALYEDCVMSRLLTYDPVELATFFKVLLQLGREQWTQPAVETIAPASDHSANLIIRENQMLRSLLESILRRAENRTVE